MGDRPSIWGSVGRWCAPDSGRPSGGSSSTERGQAFIDDDIGVHVIDVGWLAGGALAVRVPVGGRVAVVADLGAHGLLAQSSVLNIAGAVDESGNTAWVRREHGAPDTRWTVDGRRVQGPGELPYRFSGASASVAVVVRMP